MKFGKYLTVLASSAILLCIGCRNSSDKKKDGSGDSSSKDPSGANGGDGDPDGTSPSDNEQGSKDADGTLPDPDHTNTKPGKGNGELLYTYIWIANSIEGTISKINTRTMVEEGRYQTRPDRLGSPSRTSVGISGDVVVANRGGGVTKFYADKEDCVDKNKDGVIQTSTGKDNVLKWGEDECMAWYNPMTYGSQRVVAWTYEEKSGGPDSTDKIKIERVWVTGIHETDARIFIHLLDGDNGKILKSAETTGVPAPFPYGAYGGAVDRDNDLWFSNSHTATGKLVRVSYEDMSVKIWDRPFQSYGITVDPKGRPWICGVSIARFTPQSEKWDAVQLPIGRQSALGGCMVDGKGRLWLDVSETNALPTVTGIDIETLKVRDTVVIPEHPHGVSIDFDGNIWGVGMLSTKAYRVNPDTKKVDTFDGLSMAYTYSDMTGFALGAVQDNPPI